MHTCFSESRVPYWQKSISQAHNGFNDTLIWFGKEIWLPSLRIDVRMRPEKRCKCTYLIPPNEHFHLRITEVGTYIS